VQLGLNNEWLENCVWVMGGVWVNDVRVGGFIDVCFIRNIVPFYKILDINNSLVQHVLKIF